MSCFAFTIGPFLSVFSIKNFSILFNISCSFLTFSLYCPTAFSAFPIIFPCPVKVANTTPVNINITIIVITNAINVIPFLFFNIFSPLSSIKNTYLQHCRVVQKYKYILFCSPRKLYIARSSPTEHVRQKIIYMYIFGQLP